MTDSSKFVSFKLWIESPIIMHIVSSTIDGISFVIRHLLYSVISWMNNSISNEIHRYLFRLQMLNLYFFRMQAYVLGWGLKKMLLSRMYEKVNFKKKSRWASRLLPGPGYYTEKETQMYRTDFGILWERGRVGCSERIALKQVYYQGWNRSPAQIGCMRQVLRAGALGRPRGMGWGGKREGGSGWGKHVNPWLIHVNVWQKPLQYCKVISLQLIKNK